MDKPQQICYIDDDISPKLKGFYPMKKQLILPVGSVVFGAAAFVLRLTQNKTGFESSTGLPIPGNFAGIALIGLFLVAAVVMLFLSRSQKAEILFPADFSTTESSLMMLPVMGILLLLGSGLLDALAIINPGAISFSDADPSPAQLLFSATAIVAAAALLPAASACRIRSTSEPAADSATDFKKSSLSPDTCLPIVPVCLVIRLVLSYRICSVNPSLEKYYVELLALVFLTLTFFLLSSCGVQPTSRSRFTLASSITVVLALAVMADPLAVSARLLYLGGCLTALGFLLLQAFHSSDTPS